MRRLALLAVLVGLALAQAVAAQEERPRRRGGDRAERQGGRRGGFLRRLDTNGDGVIGRDEFRGSAELFAKLDQDGDGGLSEEEARQYGRVSNELMWEKVDREGIFNAIDGDGDGIITKDEFRAAALAEIVGRAIQKVRADARGARGEGEGGRDRRGGFVKRMDKDGDGKVSRDEFQGDAERFDKIDADKDGFIDDKEVAEAWRQARERRGRKGAEEQQQ